MNDYDRDYDLQDEKLRSLDDERFHIARNEAAAVQVTFFADLFVVFGLVYAITPADAEKLTYFLGWPLWLVIGSCIFLISTFFLIFYFLRSEKKYHFSLEAREKEEKR